MLFQDLFKKIYTKNAVQKVEYEVDDSDKNTLFENTHTYIGKWANYTLAGVIICAIGLVIFESIGDNSQIYLREIFFIDAVLSLVFAGEYMYRFFHSDNKKHFPFRIWNIFDLLSFLPFFIFSMVWGMGNYAFFTIFRVFRIIKIFELFNKMPITKRVCYGIYQRRLEYGTGGFFILTGVLFFSTVMYYIEYNFGNAEQFQNILYAIWWTCVTLTTLGYGDIVPFTMVGKMIAIILMFLGPVIIAILSSITVLVFMESTHIISMEQKKNVFSQACPRCKTINPSIHNYCKQCGEKL